MQKLSELLSTITHGLPSQLHWLMREYFFGNFAELKYLELLGGPWVRFPKKEELKFYHMPITHYHDSWLMLMTSDLNSARINLLTYAI